jgi:hypothetical protein
MKTTINHALTSNQSKDSHFFKRQRNKYFAYLLLQTASNSMVCNAIGIECKHGTRHKRKLEKLGLLKVIHIGICQLTKYSGVQYLSTNPEIILKKND